MKNKAVMVGVLALAMGVGGRSAEAAEANASLDLASAYVFRGVTINDGWVAQPGLEVDGLPVTLGVWGNVDIDDQNGAYEKGQISEVDLYVLYDLPLEMDKVDLGLDYTDYTYPNGGEADREVGMTATVDLLLSPTLGVYYGVDGAVDESLYVEAGLSHEFEISEDVAASLGAALGFNDPKDGDRGFSHYTTTAGVSYKALYARVTYVGQIDDDVLPDAGEEESGYDVDVYGLIGAAYDF